jgi:hypothetical protein
MNDTNVKEEQITTELFLKWLKVDLTYFQGFGDCLDNTPFRRKLENIRKNITRLEEVLKNHAQEIQV